MRVRLTWSQRVRRWRGPLLALAALAIPVALQFERIDVVRVHDGELERYADRWVRFGAAPHEGRYLRAATWLVNESQQPISIYRVDYGHIQVADVVPPGGIGAAPEIHIVGAGDRLPDDDSYAGMGTGRTWMIRAE